MSTRRIVWQVLSDVIDGGAYAFLALKEALKNTEPAQAGAVSALTYTTLEHLIYIDYMLSHFAKGRVRPAIRNVLRIGVCEILFMNTPAHAACNEAVALTREIGKAAQAGYVNGVLRNVERQKDALPPLPQETGKRLSVAYSWPEWLVREWLQTYGEETTRKMLAAPATPMSVRPHPPTTCEQLEQELRSRGIRFVKGNMEPNCYRLDNGYDIAATELFQTGGVAVQSESAMLVCRAMGLRDGMRVLDACAAPGGKTAYMAALARCDITAWELHPHRMQLMEAAFRRMRVSANTACRDASIPDVRYLGAFDAVLVDAPCSGLGVSGKPDVRYTKTPEGMKTLEKTQAQILNACAEYVKPGGILVYATCTVRVQENEWQVREFLKGHPAFCPDDIRPYWPGKQPEGLEMGMVQLQPYRDGSEGFFIARMRRCD